MRISRLLLLLSLSLVLSAGCKTRQAASSTSGSVQSNEQSPQSTTSQPTEPAAPAEPKIYMGRDIVSETVSRLGKRLEANNEVTVRIKAVILQSFNEAGYQLHEPYPDTQAKYISKEIVKKSSDQILPVLDSKQQRTFKKLIAE